MIRGRGRGARSARLGPSADARGQSTVEFAMVLPIFLALVMLLFQVALVGRDEVRVVHAARVAAREAAVTSDRARIEAAATASLPGAHVRVITRGAVGQPVDVEVDYVSPTRLPVIGALLPDVRMQAHAVMQVER